MCALLASILVGVPTSLITSLIAWCMRGYCEMRRQRKMYGRLPGEYEGYRFSVANGRELEPRPSSTAKVCYEHGNILSIQLTHDARTWHGTLTMESESTGGVVWRYTDLGEGKREFGFKRCIVGEGEIYLVGDAIDGYGREVLKRLPT